MNGMQFVLLVSTAQLMVTARPPPSDAAPLPGQIIVDPQNPSWLKYQDGGPFFLCGPGDPKDFLYRGSLRWRPAL